VKNIFYPLIFFIFMIFVSPIFGSQTTILKIELTNEEIEFIKAHPVIKVANDQEWAPFDFFEKGKAKGYSVDYLRLLSNIIGIELEFVQDSSWDRLIERFEAKDIDVITAYEDTKDNKEYAHFTEPYLETFESIIIRSDTPFLKNYLDLYGKKVAIVKGYDYEKYVVNEHKQITVIAVDTPLEGLKKLSFGEVDAFLENTSVANYLIKKHSMVNLALAGDPSFPGLEAGDKIRIATRKDWLPLHNMFVKAIQALPEEESAKLRDKWLLGGIKGVESSLRLDEKEEAWLAKNGKILYAIDPSWLPIEGIDPDGGKHEGISADLLQFISEKSGLQFELIKTNTFQESTNLAKSGKVDMLMAVSKTKEREELFNFSNPLFDISSVVVMRGDGGFISDLSQLNGKKVGVSEGNSLHKMLIAKYPKIITVPLKGVGNSLQKLSDGEVDAYLENLEVISYQINKLGLFNLKVVLRLDEKRTLYTVFGKHLPQEVLSIYNKALEGIEKEEIERIHNKWINSSIEKEIDYILLFEIVAVALGGALVLFYLNYQLKKRVREKTADLEKLTNSLEEKVEERTLELKGAIEELTTIQGEIDKQKKYLEMVLDAQNNIVITTDGKKIRSANRAFLDFYHVNNLSEFLKDQECICDTFEQKDGYLQKNMPEGRNWLEYLLEHKGVTHKVAIRGSVFTVEATMFGDLKELFYLAVFTDITPLEIAQQEMIKSKKHQELAMRGGKMGAWNVDFETGEMAINERWAQMLGYKLEEIAEPVREKWLATIHQDDMNKVSKVGSDYRVGELDDYEVEYRAITKDGKVRWFASKGEAVERDKDGNVLKMAGVVMDITERKEVEEKIKEFNRKITDSIAYASLIQGALLPNRDMMEDFFGEFFCDLDSKGYRGWRYLPF